MKKDAQIIRELAKEYMAFYWSEKQQKAIRRMRDTNDLKIVRPPVLIDEIPWGELTDDKGTVCVCEDGRARAVEAELRGAIWRHKNLHCDVLMTPYWKINQAIDRTPLGLERKETVSGVQSRSFEDVMEDEACLGQILPAEFTLRPDLDERNLSYYTDLFGEAMPVKLVGVRHFSAAPWDDISFLRGVEPIYEDMYERPEYLHQIMEIFSKRTMAWMDFVEANAHVDNDPYKLHCTPAVISGLAEDGLKATWFRGMAQPFSCVSPALWKEFEFDYMKPIAERCAYTYYGCCEPLDTRLEMLKELKNLRKVGVSPWANVELCAEQLGGNYVYARKPSPSLVAIKTDPEAVRKETETAVKACIRNGCPAEFVLKDITTVSGNPDNLKIWAETVSEVLDRYYGKE